jgi:SAM-dependent methyltransferase
MFPTHPQGPQEGWQAVAMREQRTVFGEVAEVYDDVRPGYPDELVAAVLAYAGATGPPTGPVVEIGAGTGKGTEAFVRNGVAVRCVEADPRMAAVLRRRFAGDPAVRVDVGRFEDWVPPAGGVALLYCAQAWHWMDERRRCALARAALAPGGTLAVFGHGYLFADREMEATIHAVQLAVAPELPVEPPPTGPPEAHWLAVELAGSGMFADVRAYRFDRIVDFPTARYLRLVETFSPVRRQLTAARLAAFRAALAEAIDAAGGVVTVRLDTVLALGREPSREPI